MPRAKSPKRVAGELGFKLNRLEVFAEGAKRHYRKARIPKKPDPETGEQRGFRDLRVPDEQLAMLHTQIRKKYLQRELPAFVHGGVSGKSNITNATTHRGNKYFFVTDLRDFFPGVRPHMAYRVFVEQGLSADAARLLTRITTLEGGVPQGSPSSMHLANLSFSPIDDALALICVRFGLTYTRFVDDLTFSSRKDFKVRVSDIIGVVSEGGFRINNRKTYFKAGLTDVTGIRTARSRLRPPTRLLKKLDRLEPGSTQRRGLEVYIAQIFNSSLN